MEEIKVSKDFKKSFNLGYEIAKELNLVKPLFKNQTKVRTGTNPIQLGMLEFIAENQVTVGENIEHQNSKPMKRIKDKNNGKGLTL